MPTYKELVRKRAELEAQIEVARQAEVAKVIEQLQATIAEYGLTASDIWATGPKKQGGGKVVMAAKYLNPQTGQTWSGRGRAPLWIGKNRDRFLIEK